MSLENELILAVPDKETSHAPVHRGDQMTRKKKTSADGQGFIVRVKAKGMTTQEACISRRKCHKHAHTHTHTHTHTNTMGPYCFHGWLLTVK